MSTAIDEDDLTLESLNNMSLKSSNQTFSNQKVKDLFQIESKHLNSDNEMIRMFGARIVQGERNASTGYNTNPDFKLKIQNIT